MRTPRRGPIDRERTLEEAARGLPSRRTRDHRRRNAVIGGLLAVAIVTGIGLWVFDPAVLGGGTKGSAAPASIGVQLGSPAGGTVACQQKGSMVSERISWLGSTSPVSTTQFRPEVQELGDGDVIGSNNGPGEVTPTILCLGTNLTYVYDWYVVLQAPNGTNGATYTYADGWAAVPPATLPIEVLNGSTMVLLSASDLAGIGYAFEVLPAGGGPAVNGFTTL